MTRISLKIVVLLVIAAFCAPAQEKPTPGGKAQPDPRALGITAPDSLFKSAARDSATKATQNLPKFDLPEYVITGAVSIDLPDVEKQDPAEPPITLEQPNPLDAARDRSTVEYASEKEGLMINPLGGQNGRILASSGTYFTSKIGLWANALKPGYSLFGDAGYGVSNAYLPNTNRSGGHLNVSGAMLLRGPSDLPGGARVTGDLGYANEVYRFYGSPSPGVSRSLTRFRLGAGLESARDLLFTYGARAGVLVTALADSSSNSTETQINFGFESNLLVSWFPLDGRIDLSFASIGGSGSGTLPYIDASLLTPKHWFGDLFVQGSAHVYVTQGMLGQKFARVYPNVEAGYKILQGTLLSAAYLGKVQFNTLSKLVETNPYVSALSTIRQSDIPVNILVALETDWDAVWRTRFSARYQSVREYPLLTEGGLGTLIPLFGALGHKGVWMTEYLGTTSIMTYQADAFAKFGANSYFTSSLEINSSKNSKTQLEIPYLPQVRVAGGAQVELLSGLTVHPTVAFVGRRVPDLYEPTKLKEYVVFGIQGTYSPLRFLDIVLDIQNLTDTKYDEWNGYRATPFVMTAGIGFRW